MKIAVTGGAGFIGSHLVEKLVSLGENVVVVDNLWSGKLDNLANVLPKIDFKHVDIREKSKLMKSFEDVNAVVHLAALTSVQESIVNPLLYREVNSKGTLNVLNQSMDAGVKRFIFISSAAVYGNPSRVPINESHPTKPLSPYAESKLEAEEYCKSNNTIGKISTIILRLFNVYGQRQSFNQYSGVITQFIRRISRDEPPIIYGDGEQYRDFIYVGDAVEYISKAIKSNIQETINIGTGTKTTINQLAQIIAKVSEKSHIEPLHKPVKEGDIRQSTADVSRAVEALEYVPRMSLEDGLRKTIASPDSSKEVEVRL